MSVDFKVRINLMKIHSIDDFFMVRGGMRGGALLNIYGEIIGITSGHIGDSQNINLAVSCENIKAFAGNFIK